MCPKRREFLVEKDYLAAPVATLVVPACWFHLSAAAVAGAGGWKGQPRRRCARSRV
jgi:hypothetical protein